MSMTNDTAAQGGYVHQGMQDGDARDNARRGSQIRIALLAEKANLEKAAKAVAGILGTAKLGYGILDFVPGADLSEIDGYQKGHELYINLEDLRMAYDSSEDYKKLVIDLFKALNKAGVQFADVNRQADDASFNCVDGIELPFTYSNGNKKCADVKVSLVDLKANGISIADVASVHQQVVDQQQARVDAAIEKLANLVKTYQDLMTKSDALEDLLRIDAFIHNVQGPIHASTYSVFLQEIADALPLLEECIDSEDKDLLAAAKTLTEQFNKGEDYLAALHRFAELAGSRMAIAVDEIKQHPHYQNLLFRVLTIGNDEKVNKDIVNKLADQFARVSPQLALDIKNADAQLQAEQVALRAIQARHLPDLAGLKAEIDAIEADFEKDRLALIIAPEKVQDEAAQKAAEIIQTARGQAISAIKNAQQQLLASIKPLYEHLEAANENASAKDNYVLEMVVELTKQLLKDPTNADLQTKYRQVAEEVEGYPTLGAKIAQAMITFAGVALAVGSLAALFLAAPAVLGTTALTVGTYTITNATLAYSGVAAGASTALAGRYFLGQRCGTSRDMVDVAENVFTRAAIVQV